MGLWDEIDENEEIYDVGNLYLDNPEKSMELIAKLLPAKIRYGNEEKTAHVLDWLIDFQIMRTLRHIHIDDSLDLGQHLQKISDQLMEFKKLQMLKDKTIIGIGGQFSAGKSCFINSLLGVDEPLLPENQNATTSIPTYLMRGMEEKIQAFSAQGRMIDLNSDEMQALTHQFFETYKIGFARFIKNLIIQTPLFPEEISKKVVLLDTPGYSKADVETKQTVSDAQIAKQQLKAADFLIWLIDIDNGIIRESDIQFIRELDIHTPILFIFNKADKKIESDQLHIIQESKKVLDEKNINVFGITAYSSLEGDEYLGNTFVQQLMETAVEYADNKVDAYDELDDTIQRIDKRFIEVLSNLKNRQHELQNEIYKSENVLAIRSLVAMYKEAVDDYRKVNYDQHEFTKISRNIKHKIQSLDK